MTSKPDIQKQNEVGFKIKEINDLDEDFEVVVDLPVPKNRKSRFKFSKNSDWLETKKYVEDGEIKEDPRWFLKVKRTFENKVKNASKDKAKIEKQKEKYEGRKLQV